MQRLFTLLLSLLLISCASQKNLRKADLRKDVLLETNYGTMRVRLSNETPLHKDNFLKLTKNGYYNGVLFHRVINKFMIQAGDPDSRKAVAGKPLGEGGPAYTVPAEFRADLFHKKGVIAAAREGDDVNPQKASSGSQFYIVQGKIWTDGGLDTLEVKRLNGRKIPRDQRTVYKTIGGTPHLDQNYTVFGEVIEGLNVIDSIAAVATSKEKDKDRPLKDVVIKKARLVKRK
jgi:cyclophilin family peptidyl-prolyl cis-trans isomerase